MISPVFVAVEQNEYIECARSKDKVLEFKSFSKTFTRPSAALSRFSFLSVTERKPK